MSKYEIDVWEYADEFKNLDTNETFGGYAVCELLEQKDQQIAELQQKLKSQPAEIVEKIKKQIFNHFNVKNMEEYENLSLIDSLFTADAVIEMLDTILKEYGGNNENRN